MLKIQIPKSNHSLLHLQIDLENQKRMRKQLKYFMVLLYNLL